MAGTTCSNQSICYGTCYTGCYGTCEATCRPWCGADCTGCGGGCANTCEGCSGECTGCSNTCNNTCKGTCETGCTGSCKGTCNSGCSSEANASAYAALTLDTYFKNVDMTNLKAVISAAAARRGASVSLPSMGVGATISASDMTSINNSLSNIGFNPGQTFTAGATATKNSGNALITKAKNAYETVSGRS